MSVNILEIAINNAKKETIKSTTKDKNLNYRITVSNFSVKSVASLLHSFNSKLVINIFGHVSISFVYFEFRFLFSAYVIILDYEQL